MVDGSWYRTGDLGYINDDRYLVIYDRIKDIIKYKELGSTLGSPYLIIYVVSAITDMDGTSTLIPSLTH